MALMDDQASMSSVNVASPRRWFGKPELQLAEAPLL
jgi:hypothetical protein